MLKSKYLSDLYTRVVEKNPSEPEYHQAVLEVLENKLFENASVILERVYQKRHLASIKDNLIKALIGLSKQTNTPNESKLLILRKAQKIAPENKYIEKEIQNIETLIKKQQNAN